MPAVIRFQWFTWTCALFCNMLMINYLYLFVLILIYLIQDILYIFLQVGSADHHIHYYDLRNISRPVHVFSGHRKAVSYVKFLSNYELASASTDSTLRLWDVKENLPVSNLNKRVWLILTKFMLHFKLNLWIMLTFVT